MEPVVPLEDIEFLRRVRDAVARAAVIDSLSGVAFSEARIAGKLASMRKHNELPEVYYEAVRRLHEISPTGD